MFGSQGPAFGAFGSKAAAATAFGSSGPAFGGSQGQPKFGSFSGFGGGVENGGAGELPVTTAPAKNVTLGGARNNSGFQGGGNPSFRRVTENPLFNSPPEDTDNVFDGRLSPLVSTDRPAQGRSGTSLTGNTFNNRASFGDTEMQNNAE